METNDDALYSAFAANDTRFDGVFFVAVTSTHIYCRPVCTAKTPRRSNCRFYKTASAAEKAGFRPCLRCRPELAPGSAPIDDSSRIAAQISQRLEEGAAGESETRIEQIADEFELSSRQLRRIVAREFGVSPIELIQSRRLLLAKQLLTETSLKIIDVAHASGYASLRRFNDAFVKNYRMPPSALRRRIRANGDEPDIGQAVTLRLAYRPPFAWTHLLNFLSTRAIRGVEFVDSDSYHRTLKIGEHVGTISVRHDEPKHRVCVEISSALIPAIAQVIRGVRRLFDLDAAPHAIAQRLGTDPLLGDSVSSEPGLRVPGAIDVFELAVRAILGQQVTVAGASTLAGRYAQTFGAPIATTHPELTHLTPDPSVVANATEAALRSLGITQPRARAIICLASQISTGRLRITPHSNPEDTIRELLQTPGIGPWTAHYIAMRATGWPDAFPKEDMVIRKAMGGLTPAQAQDRAEQWRPWRSYAVMHLWRGSA